MKRPQGTTTFPLRMPADVRKQVESESEMFGRSMNAEIIYRLRRAYFPEKYKRAEDETA